MAACRNGDRDCNCPRVSCSVHSDCLGSSSLHSHIQNVRIAHGHRKLSFKLNFRSLWQRHLAYLLWSWHRDYSSVDRRFHWSHHRLAVFECPMGADGDWNGLSCAFIVQRYLDQLYSHCSRVVFEDIRNLGYRHWHWPPPFTANVYGGLQQHLVD